MALLLDIELLNSLAFVDWRILEDETFLLSVILAINFGFNIWYLIPPPIIAKLFAIYELFKIRSTF
jgi:hypothetical protein